MEQGTPLSTKTKTHRFWAIGAVVIVVGSLSGFMIGIGQHRSPGIISRPEPVESPEPPHTGIVHQAVSYDEIADSKLRPNANWPGTLRDQLPATRGDSAPTTLTEIERRALVNHALALRAERRQFNGAPPVIPHPVDPVDARSCMACHGDGMVVGELRIPRMSHEYMANCLQCHAPVSREFNPPPGIEIASNFQGVAAPVKGERAMPGAPPQIPHTTHMRQDCLSCHGPTGLAGMRTSHPERQNCLQCHGVSAVLDQAGMIGPGIHESPMPWIANP